ncbi:MAG: hypothetical protein ACK5UA_05435 [Cereibacter sp.]
MALDEDRAGNRKGNGPENRAILCKFSVKLLGNASPKNAVDRERKRTGRFDGVARSAIGQMRLL